MLKICSSYDKKLPPVVITILLLYPLVGMGLDLIAPSLPSMSKNLFISNVFSKNLIAIYLIGYGISNLVCGFLSDAMGRKKLLLGGLLLFALVSLLPAIFVSSYVILFLARLLQGVAMGTFGSVARAVLSDVVPENQLKEVFSWLATMWGIGPIIGPIIGAYLQSYLGWSACFYFFSLLGTIGFIAMFFTATETVPHIKPLNTRLIYNNFKIIINNNEFISLVILMGSAYSMLLVFSTLGPFLIQIELKKTAIYFGNLAVCMGCAFLFGTFFCRFLMQKNTSANILRGAILGSVSIILITLLLSKLFRMNVVLVCIPSVLLMLTMGVLYPTAMGMAASLFRNLAGGASALMNFIIIIITTLVILGMSFIDKGSSAIWWIYSFLVLIMVLCYTMIDSRKNFRCSKRQT